MYRVLEHTADVGFAVEAPTLHALFADAGRALMALMVDDADAFTAAQCVCVELAADRADDLLFDFLSELLYRFATDRFVPARYRITLRDTHLNARLCGDTFDPDRHAGGNEVKAVTYHGLRVEPTATGYAAEVIVDV
jgi:SHS2 domain-containing protein